MKSSKVESVNCYTCDAKTHPTKIITHKKILYLIFNKNN